MEFKVGNIIDLVQAELWLTRVVLAVVRSVHQIRFHESGEAGDDNVAPAEVRLHFDSPAPTQGETVAASTGLAIGAGFGAAPINSHPSLPAASSTARQDEDGKVSNTSRDESAKVTGVTPTRHVLIAGMSNGSPEASDDELEPPRKLMRQGTPLRGSVNADKSPSVEDDTAASGDEADALLANDEGSPHHSHLPPTTIVSPKPILHNSNSGVHPVIHPTVCDEAGIPKEMQPRHHAAIQMTTMGRAVSEQTHVAPAHRKGVRFLAGSGGSRESDSTDKSGSSAGSQGKDDEKNHDQELGASDDIRVRGIPENLHWVYRLLDPQDNEVTFKHLNDHPEIWTDKMLEEVVRYIRPHDLTTILSKGLRSDTRMLDRNVTISFRNLSFTDDEGRPKLQGITGYIRPKMMMCVLGGPDAGITTFLDVLAGRQKGCQVTGELLCDGKPLASALYKNRAMGYVTKEDTNLPTLTVRETLTFAGTLRSKKVRPALIQLRVNIILKFMGMSHVAESIVGNAQVRGISGGEKRRLSYACEMMAGHATVIADLPTNGLDSASAYSVLSAIQKGCMAGRSMACSLVQPSPELFRLFSHVMVLSKGAQLYFGPATQVELYFGHHGFKRPRGKELPDFLEELSTTPGKFYVGAPPSPVEYLQRISIDPSEEHRMVDIDSLQARSVALSKSGEYAWSQVTDAEEHTLNCTNDDSVMKATIDQSMKTSIALAHGDVSAGGRKLSGANGAGRISSFRKDPPPSLDGGGIGGGAYKSMVGGRLPTISSADSADSSTSSPVAGPGVHSPAPVHPAPAIASSAAPQKKLRGLKQQFKSFLLPDKDLFDVPFEEMDRLVDQERALNASIQTSIEEEEVRDVSADEAQYEHLLQRKWVWMVQCYRRSPIYSALGQRMFADMLQPKGEPKPYIHSEVIRKGDPNAPGAEDNFKFHSTIWQQIYLATWRQWMITIRNPAFTKGAFFRNVLIGLLIGSLFYMIGTSYTDARTRFGLFYFSMTFCRSVVWEE